MNLLKGLVIVYKSLIMIAVIMVVWYLIKA